MSVFLSRSAVFFQGVVVRAFPVVLALALLSACQTTRPGTPRASSDPSPAVIVDSGEYAAAPETSPASSPSPPVARSSEKPAPVEVVPGPPRRNEIGRLPQASASGRQISYSQMSVSGPYVAMTFDDGPHPTNTPELLDILAARNIKATFYVIGQNAERYPAIMRRIVREGHEIGNHTYTHPYLTKLSDAGVRQQLRRTHQAIVNTSGKAPTTLRPPYGAINQRQKEWIYREFGYPTIMWSVDPRDWERPGVSVVTDRILGRTRQGSVILAHDIHAPTITAMPRTLDGLLDKGYRFVTVSQLIDLDRETRGGSALEKPLAQH